MDISSSLTFPKCSFPSWLICSISDLWSKPWNIVSSKRNPTWKNACEVWEQAKLISGDRGRGCGWLFLGWGLGRGNFLRFWKCSVLWLGWWLHRYLQLSKTIDVNQTIVKYLPEWPSLKSLQIINAGAGVEKRESFYTVGGNVSWCGHCGKQYGVSSKH